MDYKTDLKITFTFVGTLIGAGFASGKEIALFFGKSNIFAPLSAGLLCGVLAYVFLELGRISGGNLLAELFPKTKKIWRFLVSLANAAVFSAMLAGAEYAVASAIGMTGGGLFTGLFALAVVISGIERIKLVNLITAPLVISLIIFLYFAEPSFNTAGSLSLFSPLLYASMNILTGGYLVSSLSRDLSKKQTLRISLTIAAILSVLITLVYFAVKGNPNDTMPILAIAERYGLHIIGSAALYIAVLTTMIGALSVASNNNKYLAASVSALGFIAASFGFSAIVNYSYPVIGVLGVFLSAAAVLKLIIISKKSRSSVLLKTNSGNARKFAE